MRERERDWFSAKDVKKILSSGAELLCSSLLGYVFPEILLARHLCLFLFFSKIGLILKPVPDVIK